MTNKKRKILTASIVTPVVAATSIPLISIAISNTISQNAIYQTNKSLNQEDSVLFDNKIFNSKDDLMDYANLSVETHKQTTQKTVKFTVENDFVIDELNSVDELNNFINSKIQTYNKNASREISTNAIGEISSRDELFLTDTDEEKVNVYRGKDNTIKKTENDAKDSYFVTFEPYFFKDVYFRSKEELSLWLERNTNQWWDNAIPTSIVLKAPNGQTSQPIQFDNIDEESTKTYIKDFVKINSLSNIQLTQSTGDTKEIRYYDKNNLEDFKEEYNPSYIKVTSNGGLGSYIIDTARNDEGDMNGVYFVSSASPMKNIMNKDLWRETTNMDRLDVSQYDDMKVFNEFFDSFLGMNYTNYDQGTYNIFFNVNNPELQKTIDDYYDELCNKYPSLYKGIQQTFESVSVGQRSTSFYKIPILFYYTLDQIVYQGLPQQLVDQTRNVFIQITDYYDACLEDSIPEELMKSKDGREKFSFKKLFNIESQNLDLNVNLESFSTHVMENFTEFKPVSKAIPAFETIKAQLGSTYTMPFDFDTLNEAFDLGMDPKNEYWYRLLWYAVSTDNYSDIGLSRWLFKSNTDLSNPNLDMSEACNNISNNYYANFVGQWQRTIIYNEAIRFALTHSKWIYTDEQVSFFKALDFMGFKETTDLNKTKKHFLNLEYMRDLYEVNDRKIENIFYIIMAIFNEASESSLLDLFGAPKKYSDEEYSSKIYDLFYSEILSNKDAFFEYSNNIFNLNPTDIISLSYLYDLDFDYENKSIVPNEKIDSPEFSLIKTLKTFPKKLEFDDDGNEIIDNPELEFELVEPIGRPIIAINENDNVSTYNYRNSSDNNISLYGGGVEAGTMTIPQAHNCLATAVPTVNTPAASGTDGIIGKTLSSNRMYNLKNQLPANVSSNSVVHNLETNLTNSVVHTGTPTSSQIQFQQKAIQTDSCRRLQYEKVARSQKSTTAKMKNMSKLERDEYIHKLDKISHKQYSCNDEISKNIYRQLSEEDRINIRYRQEVDEIDKKYKQHEEKMRTIIYDDERKKYKPDFDKLNNQFDKITEMELHNEERIREIDDILLDNDKLEPSQQQKLQLERERLHQEKIRYKETKLAIEQKKVNLNEEIIKKTDHKIQKHVNDLNNAKVNEFQKTTNKKIIDLEILSEDTKIELKDTNKKLNGTVERVENMSGKVDFVSNDHDRLNKRVGALVDDVEDFKTTTKRKQLTNKILGALGTAMGFLGTAMAILDMSANMVTTQSVSYTYQANNFSLIWDGGFRTSYFYGMIPGPTKGLEAMSMIEPVRIIRPQNESGYYYNGYVYSTEAQLQRMQNNDILNGIYTPQNVKSVFSFERIQNHSIKNKDYVNADLDTLADNVYNSIRNSIVNGTQLPAFAEEYDYKLDLDSIYNINVEDKTLSSMQKAKEKLLNQIKPVKIAYIPNLQEGNRFPISRNDTKDDGSIPEFVLPYKSFTSTQGGNNGIKENNDVKPFVFVNQNEGKYKGLSDEEADAKLLELFREQFDVPMKTTTKNEILFTNMSKFSDLSTNVNEITIYKATGAFGNVKEFLNSDDAFNFIWNSYGIRAIVKINTNTVYTYKDKIFNTKQEYITWVLKNMEIING